MVITHIASISGRLKNVRVTERVLRNWVARSRTEWHIVGPVSIVRMIQVAHERMALIAPTCSDPERGCVAQIVQLETNPCDIYVLLYTVACLATGVSNHSKKCTNLLTVAQPPRVPS